MDKVGLCLPQPILNHGQIYVTICYIYTSWLPDVYRVRSFEKCKMQIIPNNKKNIQFIKIFYNNSTQIHSIFKRSIAILNSRHSITFIVISLNL